MTDMEARCRAAKRKIKFRQARDLSRHKWALHAKSWFLWAISWLWIRLPDKCSMPQCPRTGVRGNENIIDGKLMCDHCADKYIESCDEETLMRITMDNMRRYVQENYDD